MGLFINKNFSILFGVSSLCFLIINNNFQHAESAVAMSMSHSHSQHRHHSPSPSKERIEDGAFNPRDHKHFDGDSGHNVEFDHEAILGSTKEAQEFDNLPPEEAKKRLKVLVEKMDLNNDKQIDKNELKAWIIRSFKLLSKEESKEKLDEVDENEDGKVSWKEFVDETYGINSDDIPIAIQDLEEQRMLGDDKALFHTADKNKDGYLDENEYVSFTHPEEDQEMLPVIYQQTMADKDKNNDGFIDFSEYIGDRAKDKDTAWLNGEKDIYDTEHDKNGDGLLDRQEVLSWVVPSNDEIAEDETNHLFATSDDDQDNVLSYDEILDHHEIFVGSEATDYGDHLNYLDRFKDEL